MGIEIETCGNTTDTCGICYKPAYKYVCYDRSDYRITCNDPVCIVQTINRLCEKDLLIEAEETTLYVVPDVCPTCGHREQKESFLDD